MRILFTITLVFIMANQTMAFFSIDDVNIMPANPTSSDDITINADGQVNFGGWTFNHSDFTANGSDLILDFYFDVPDTVYWVFTSWEQSKQIGTLSADDYNLTVNTYSVTTSGTSLDDTFDMSFTVVPEPITAVFLGLGCLLIRKI